MRSPPERKHLVRRGHMSAPGVPLGHPLQHQKEALLVRTPVPEHLRDPLHRYAGIRRVIHHPCPQAGGRAHRRRDRRPAEPDGTGLGPFPRPGCGADSWYPQCCAFQGEHRRLGRPTGRRSPCPTRGDRDEGCRVPRATPGRHRDGDPASAPRHPLATPRPISTWGDALLHRGLSATSAVSIDALGILSRGWGPAGAVGLMKGESV